MNKEETKRLNDKIQEYIWNFIEARVWDGSCSDTDAGQDSAYLTFLDSLDSDQGLVDEILEESGIEVNEENRRLVLKLA